MRFWRWANELGTSPYQPGSLLMETPPEWTGRACTDRRKWARDGRSIFSLHDRSLEQRRATSRLCMLYQIYHGSIGIPHDPYILPYRHTPRPSRQTDMHTLATCQCRTNYFKCSFFPQTIVAWNALTKSVVTSSTLDAFKAALPLGRPIPC